MRIATWNIERCKPGDSVGASRLELAMTEIDADVWVLSETFQGFSRRPDHKLIAWSTAPPDREAAAEECWVAIWSRLGGEPSCVTADSEKVAAARAAGYLVVGTVLPWSSTNRTGCCLGLPRSWSDWPSRTKTGTASHVRIRGRQPSTTKKLRPSTIYTNKRLARVGSAM
jgi:hypothetical protein